MHLVELYFLQKQELFQISKWWCNFSLAHLNISMERGCVLVFIILNQLPQQYLLFFERVVWKAKHRWHMGNDSNSCTIKILKYYWKIQKIVYKVKLINKKCFQWRFCYILSQSNTLLKKISVYFQCCCKNETK